MSSRTFMALTVTFLSGLHRVGRAWAVQKVF